MKKVFVVEVFEHLGIYHDYKDYVCETKEKAEVTARAIIDEFKRNHVKNPNEWDEHIFDGYVFNLARKNSPDSVDITIKEEFITEF